MTCALLNRSMLVAALAIVTCPANADDYLTKLKNLSLDSLSEVEVSIASKAPEKANESAAAIYVVTAEDIRRTGATNIPEALRIVPGMNIGAVTGNTYAVSSRGFHDIYANKFLVMIDGRSVYTPLFSGVWWDMQTIVMEDIERIEVIRGPGGAIWGANAMNGVINIITRSSYDTQSTMITGLVGDKEQEVSVRSGGAHNDLSYRIWGKFFDREPNQYSDANKANDGWNQGRVGVRVDGRHNNTGTYSISTEHYRGDSDQALILTEVIGSSPFLTQYEINDRQHYEGEYINGQWQQIAESGTLVLSAFYDNFERDDFRISQKQTTYDAAAQFTWDYSSNGNLTTGVSYRHTKDIFCPSEIDTFQLLPITDQHEIYSLFAQEDHWVIPEKLKITAGGRFDRNSFTGWEFQPSLRALWTFSEQQQVWVSASKSVRTPSRIERNMRVNTSVLVEGNVNQNAETLFSYEIGWRSRPAINIYIDATAFRYKYDNLSSLRYAGGSVTGVIPPSSAVFQPRFLFDNAGSADSYGIEITSKWVITDQWQLSASYSWLTVDESHLPDDQISALAVDSNPEHQLHIRSNWNITNTTEADLLIYYVDELRESATPSYTRTDLRFGWQINPALEASLIAKNIFDSQHPEYIPSSRNVAGGVIDTELERSIAIKLTWLH